MESQDSSGDLDETWKVNSDLVKMRQEVLGKPNFFLRDIISEIYSEENGFAVYLGSGDDACNLQLLEEMEITHVLNLAAHQVHTKDLYGHRYQYLMMNLEDDETYDIGQHMQVAFEFIEQARRLGKGVLVHCVAGISRSPTIVIAYLMTYQKWSLKKAAQFVQQKRPQIYPNDGFFKYLLSYEASLTKNT